MATRKQKLRAAATDTPLGQPAKAAKQIAKIKKTSRGK
jgi:alkanesulfonate monooxygenase SsuD/methylene tetrahydromethanopterin reductase-like flavin-dependent oxidoreductase (luciferase family)